MDITLLVLLIVVLILLVIAFLQQRNLPLAGLQAAGITLWRNLPILLLGFLIAGLIQVLIPKEIINNWMGAQAGAKGILIGCVVGGLVPGAPYAVFPLIASLYRSGAGLGSVVGFISAWSLWSVSRLPLEIALIDPKPALMRYAITFIIPPIAGFLAQAVARFV
ncbi:MAG: permease [Anaerolineales bacterium]|nr:permease [Anaerolineales bacterium]